MSIEKSVLEKLLNLPLERQKKDLEFVEALKENAGPQRRRRSLKGLWADLGVENTPEDISEARREMWGGFPKSGYR